MVFRALIAAFLLMAGSAWGAEPRQFCLSCHPAHYAERGRCGDCHRGNPGSDRKNIAHSGLRAGKYARFAAGDTHIIKEGQRLMDQFACRRCHVSAGRGNRLAAGLDASSARKTAGELASSIRQPVTNMPDFRLDDDQTTQLVNALLANAQDQAADQAAPVRVHFSASSKGNRDVFSVKCGSCHRMLSERFGVTGTGGIAPNLSGLFTRYYPKTFRNGEAWTSRNLTDWLKNPRSIRPWAGMQPVMLTGDERKNLEAVLFVSPEVEK